MLKLSVHLVTWNGEKYIPFLFDSLRKQTFHDWDLLVIDNNSTDGTVAAVQKGLINFPVASKLVVNKQNVGFAAGHNQAYNETKSDYFLIINQDLVLGNDCFEKLSQFLESNSSAAAAAPRTMKWNFNEGKFTDKIDSLGLKVFRNRRVVEIGEGEEYRRNGTKVHEVFGVSGAVAIFRRQAVADIGYLFDNDFFLYKEDVDLAHRLRSAGWKSFGITDAVAYHDRTGSGAKHKNDYSSARNKSNQNSLVRYYSYKNHLATLYKNEYWQNLTLDLPWIAWYEIKKFVYFLIFDRAVLAGLKELWRGRGELKKKREKIKSLRKLNWKEIRKWWN